MPVTARSLAIRLAVYGALVLVVSERAAAAALHLVH